MLGGLIYNKYPIGYLWDDHVALYQGLIFNLDIDRDEFGDYYIYNFHLAVRTVGNIFIEVK